MIIFFSSATAIIVGIAMFRSDAVDLKPEWSFRTIFASPVLQALSSVLYVFCVVHKMTASSRQIHSTTTNTSDIGSMENQIKDKTNIINST